MIPPKHVGICYTHIIHERGTPVIQRDEMTEGVEHCSNNGVIRGFAAQHCFLPPSHRGSCQNSTNITNSGRQRMMIF